MNLSIMSIGDKEKDEVLEFNEPPKKISFIPDVHFDQFKDDIIDDQPREGFINNMGEL